MLEWRLRPELQALQLQSRPGQSVEDVRHGFGRCNDETYEEIRTQWYGGLRDKTMKLAPALWEAIYSGLRCGRGNLSLDAWHALTGKIPILWTEAALGAGTDRSDFEKWLRWYGKEVRAALWWPLLKTGRVQRAALGASSGGFEDGDDEIDDDGGSEVEDD